MYFHLSLFPTLTIETVKMTLVIGELPKLG